MYTSLIFFCLGVSMMSSPMVMGLALVSLSLLVSLYIGAFFSKWFMFILLLVFTGGMMIMVLYIANMAAGIKIANSDLTTLMFIFSILSLHWYDNTGSASQASGLLKLQSWEILTYVMGFLLLGLFLVVFLVDKSLGALR